MGRLRWMMVLAAAALIAGGIGFPHWRGDGFPSRASALAGAPVVLHVQDGVRTREVQAVADGVRVADRYLTAVMGRPVRGPVAARIARRDACEPSESGERAVIGEGSAGALCVDTANLEWKVLISTDRAAATAVSAHEYVHVWQAELGCLPSGDEREYRWLVEGMATHLAWQALVRAERTTESRARQLIRHDIDWHSNREPLWTYEREGGRLPQYALWHLAVRTLMKHATAAGADRELSLRKFCELVGSDVPWRSAFLRAFGIPVAGFYTRFEAARPGR